MIMERKSSSTSFSISKLLEINDKPQKLQKLNDEPSQLENIVVSQIQSFRQVQPTAAITAKIDHLLSQRHSDKAPIHRTTTDTATTINTIDDKINSSLRTDSLPLWLTCAAANVPFEHNFLMAQRSSTFSFR